MNINIQRIAADSTEYPELLAIYHDSFFKPERLPDDRLTELIRQDLLLAWLFRDAHTTVGFALLAAFPQQHFSHLDYFAIKKTFRGQGIGSKMLRAVVEELQTNHSQIQALTLEVGDDAPVPGKVSNDRLRRIHFYRRLGAKLLKNVSYLFPAYGLPAPIPMSLMAFPLQSHCDISQRFIQQAIHALYTRLHSVNPDDPAFKSVLSGLPEHIELE